MIGKSQSAVANKLRLLKHSPQVLEALRSGGLTERHARALLRLPSEPQKLRAIDTITKLGMSVARTERYVEELVSGAKDPQVSQINLKGFLNHLGRSLSRIQSSGIPAVSERRETEDETVLTITIPK